MNTNGAQRFTTLAEGAGLDSLAAARRTQLRLPANLALAGWRRLGQQIALLSSSSAWWLGDWLICGPAKFPDRYRQALAKTPLDYQTLRNYAWVARKFPVSRRRDTGSFQHHAALPALPACEQQMSLDRASFGDWPPAELRTLSLQVKVTILKAAWNRSALSKSDGR
jgi:hypothetical protein